MRARLASNQHAVFLLALFLVYVAGYLLHPAAPGNNPQYPLGWFGWFDQGQYLRETNAIRNLDFSPENYFYPPLYPALGALFSSWFPYHPFYFVNAICLLLFAHFFVSVARCYVGWVNSVLLLTVSLLSAFELFFIWIEPWTTTPVASVYAFMAWELHRLWRAESLPPYVRIVCLGLLGGVVLATRPADVVVIVPVYVGLLLLLLRRSRRDAETKGSVKTALVRSLALCLSGLVGAAGYLAFNQFVYGNPLGSYFNLSANQNGFHLLDIPEKLVSILLDAGTLYGPEGEAVFEKLPWLALLVPGWLLAVFRGDLWFRSIVASVVIQMMVYLPYSDLLPTGIWKYHNIHYFKWMMPYLTLIGVYPLYQFLMERKKGIGVDRSRLMLYVGCVMLGMLLLCARIQLVDITRQFSLAISNDAGRPTISIESERPEELDLVSMPSVKGDYQNVYFGFANGVSADGRALIPVRDFRLFPMKGSGIQLLFIRPVTTASVVFDPKQLQITDDSTDIRCYRYRLSFGFPRWL